MGLCYLKIRTTIKYTYFYENIPNEQKKSMKDACYMCC